MSAMPKKPIRPTGQNGSAPSVRLVPGKPFVTLGAFGLSGLGYTLQEFFVSGTAASYTLAEDGGAEVQPGESAPYATRMFVVKPADAARFNGTVIVEWLNVSGGRDAAVVWTMAHRAMVRAGFAYIGVSAQQAGVEGGPSLRVAVLPLKVADPERYAGLAHPGDAFSYDIFSQIGALLRAPDAGAVLGSLVPERIIAAGESQSAMYLATYATAIDPVVQVFDGFLIQSRFAFGAWLDGQSVIRPESGQLPPVLRLRDDLRVPVMTVITETDLIGGPAPGFFSARQPDGPHLRVWEIAGAAHADNYIYLVGSMDSGVAGIEELAAAYAPTRTVYGQHYDKPINFGPQRHYVGQAALVGLDNWIRTGTPPPAADPIRLTRMPAPGKMPQLALDAHGMAKGGVRTPWVDVPAALLAGTGNTGPMGAWLVGVGEPFDYARLDQLYPGGRRDYLRRFEAALAAAIEAGFILPEDRQEILDVAEASYKRVR
jgi:hypothetical protein